MSVCSCAAAYVQTCHWSRSLQSNKVRSRNLNQPNHQLLLEINQPSPTQKYCSTVVLEINPKNPETLSTSSLFSSDLQEDVGVLLEQLHQLQVGDGVNDPHGNANDRHGDGQQHHVMTQGYDGEDDGDGESAGEESWETRQEPGGQTRTQPEWHTTTDAQLTCNNWHPTTHTQHLIHNNWPTKTDVGYNSFFCVWCERPDFF